MSILDYSRVLALILLFSACSSTSKVEDLEYPLQMIQDVVKENLPGPLKGVSVNGREYHTHNFKLSLLYRSKPQPLDAQLLERGQAKITILGVKRPYIVSVEVERHELASSPGQKPRYVLCCRIPEMEQAIAEKIKADLVERFKKSNFIDDFRPF